MERKTEGYNQAYFQSKYSDGECKRGEKKHADDYSPAADVLDERTEAEWAGLASKPNVGETMVAADPLARRIVENFTINSMNMRDADTGRVMWKSSNWDDAMFDVEKEARVPAEILKCRSVSREINFTSGEKMDNFRLEQRIFFQGVCMEEWYFTFGFVIPGSTNTWQQTIDAAGENEMIPAHLLSGNVTIETSFFDGIFLVGKALVRIYYD